MSEWVADVDDAVRVAVDRIDLATVEGKLAGALEVNHRLRMQLMQAKHEARLFWMVSAVELVGLVAVVGHAGGWW